MISCKQKELNIEIKSEDKIDFLNEILSDTINLKIINSKNQLISNYPFFPPPRLPMDEKNPTHSISHYEYISDTLKIDDISFVRKQAKSNNNFKLDLLSHYGFKILDVETYFKQKISHDSVREIAHEYNKKHDNVHSFLVISKPIFNKDMNLAYIRLMQGYGGETVILEKRNGKWMKKNVIDDWIE